MSDNEDNGMHKPTIVGDYLSTVALPNATTPVPFEKFAALQNSNELLERAAFWAFYTAWKTDHEPSGMPELAVQARHDGHTFSAMMHEMHLRDCIMLPAHDYQIMATAYLQEQARISREEEPQHSGVILWGIMAIVFVLGTVVGAWLW
jgi:hypothetical protein